MCMCVRACVRACVCACMRVRMVVYLRENVRYLLHIHQILIHPVSLCSTHFQEISKDNGKLLKRLWAGVLGGGDSKKEGGREGERERERETGRGLVTQLR